MCLSPLLNLEPATVEECEASEDGTSVGTQLSRLAFGTDATVAAVPGGTGAEVELCTVW